MVYPSLKHCTAAVAAVAFLFGPGNGAGQSVPNLETEWRWVDFGADAGLPPGVVRDIVEVDTLVWVRTDSAVAWYDGFRWTTPPMGEVMLTGLTSSLAPDSMGGVLLVQGGAIYQVNRRGFEALPISSRPGLLVSRAIPFTSGTVLFTSAGDASVAWVLSGGEATPVMELPPILDETSLTLTRAGRAWIDTSDGLHVFRDGRWVDRLPGDVGFGFGSKVTENRSLVGFLHGAVVSSHDRISALAGDGPVLPVENEAGNTLWAGDIAEDGLAIMAYETGDLRVYAGGAWTDLELPSNRRFSVYAIRISDNGDLWFGTAQGLHLYRRSATRFSGFRWPFPHQRNRVNAVLRTESNELWLGTGAGVMHRRAGQIPEWTDEVDGQAITGVTGLAEDADGKVWATAGAVFQGAIVWDGASWSHMDADDGLAVGYVHRVFVDGEGALWFASLGNGTDVAPGMYRWADGRLEAMSDKGLPAERAYAFAEAADGTVWMGFLSGLYSMRRDSVRAWGDFRDSGRAFQGVWDLALDPEGLPFLPRGAAGSRTLGRRW